jgi:hypothetical protein
MIKTILVPATGSDLDIAVFQSAPTVGAHSQRISKSCMSDAARFRPLEQLRSEALTDAVGPRVEMPHLLASPPQKRDDAAVVLGDRHRTGRSGRRTLSKPPSAIPEPPR